MARTLPQQKIDKGAVWATIIVGAMGLFGTTLVLENRLPAISRANQAAKESKRIMEVGLCNQGERWDSSWLEREGEDSSNQPTRP
jgi:hypothetical protein